MKDTTLDKQKLKSILSFCFKAIDKDFIPTKILESDPTYLIEKFERYIGTTSFENINKTLDSDPEFGTFLKEYNKKWHI